MSTMHLPARPLKRPIIVTEYPKSGGTWIVSLLGEALQLAKRDIYVRPGFSLFDIGQHPWYKEGAALDFPSASVNKSHELPCSPLAEFDADYVHLVRDGRDVVVSKWFFDRDFCVKNGLTSSFDMDFDTYVERTANEWASFVASWRNENVPCIRYEEFLATPVEALQHLVTDTFSQTISEEAIRVAVSKHTREKLHASLNNTFRHNTFVRKGVAGDWRNHFSERNVAAFKAVAGETLCLLGYETDSTWLL